MERDYAPDVSEFYSLTAADLGGSSEARAPGAKFKNENGGTNSERVYMSQAHIY